jgi:hypothetical protein
MSQNTRTCQCCMSTPQVAVNSSQVSTRLQGQTQWFYVSTLQAANPTYKYQYKSQTERIQALMGRLSQGQCG